MKPYSDESNELSLALSVSLPATYPNSLPTCHIAYGPGVRESIRARIDDLVNSKPKELLGSEMIFEIASSIQEILEENFVAQTHAEKVPPLNEERALQEATILKQEQDAREERLRQERDAKDEEERSLSRMVEQEQARLARIQSKEADETISFESGSDEDGQVNFDQQIKVKSPDGTLIAFRTVVNTSQYRRGPVTDIYHAYPVGSQQNFPPFLALKRCILRVLDSEEKLKKEIQQLEANLDTLVQLPIHPNILKPLTFRIHRAFSLDLAPTSWHINILTELADRGSLRDLLETTGTVAVGNVRSWAIQIIEGLEFYHAHHVVHSKLHPGNILFERAETGHAVVKLADGLFQKDLNSIKGGSKAEFSSATSVYWVAPEVASGANGRPKSSQDIWDFGVVLLQMLFGLEVQRLHASPTAVMDALNLSPSLEDLVSRIFKGDPRKRPTAFEMLSKEFLRNNDSAVEQPSSPTITRLASSSSITPSKTARIRRDSTNFITTTSRYENDFVEAGRLGKGGFGEVVRARNKLDGRIYAIKKITQSSASALSTVLGEVVLLSRLNHPNVVRYYNAFMEETIKQIVPEDSSASETSESSIAHGKTSEIGFAHSTSGLDFISSSGYPKIEFGFESSNGTEDSEATDDEDVILDRDNDRADGNIADGSGIPRRRRSSIHAPARTILYIVMEYCERHVRHLLH